ncbi:hypothetical protein HELRODRAFT_176552 [Helobdella robusta]|uniref:Leucine-rich repeat-containing protein 71 n=1 Tax=Helobdella robusta TaxID=6412 RepID=T1FAN1_HELRO|nr:hypothetical protein HELRODRAFT_176552 [Helobdella robusta]ESN99786.1 hypothetical protein HELRODRAFT_176552 [Helobdella robusta]
MVKKSDKPASKSTSRLSNHEELGADNNIKEGSKKSVSKNELKSESVATVNNDASENDAKCPPSGKVTSSSSVAMTSKLNKCDVEASKPCVQCAGLNDDDDKFDVITEFYIRGWKADGNMMTILVLCWSMQHSLHTIDTLYLDYNPICSGGEWSKLIDNSNQIRHLSLRHNDISDEVCRAIGLALGSLADNQSNLRLVSLNLSGNKVTDLGAEFIANGLKRNRTLLFLDLSSNLICDYGAQKLGMAISKFSLTTEEGLARRKFIWDAIHIYPTNNKITNKSNLHRQSKLPKISNQRVIIQELHLR